MQMTPPGGDKAKDEVNHEIVTLVEEVAPLERADFDFRVRRFLLVLRSSCGLQKVRDALAMIRTYTSQKSRESVNNWPAYLLTLLKKFEPEPYAKGRNRGDSGGTAAGGGAAK